MAVRIQAPDLPAPQRLRSTPVRSPTFVRPALDPNAGRMAAGLADALVGLNAKLQPFTSSALAAQEKTAERSVSRFAGMTTDQFRAELDKGTDPTLKTDAVQANYGMRVAGDLLPKIDEAVAGLDKVSGNYEGTVRPMVAQAMQGLSPVAAEAFAKTMDPYVQRGMNAWGKAQVEQTQAGQADGASAQYQSIIAKLSDEGKTPAQIASAVWEAHSSNVKRLGLDPRGAEGIVYGIAKAAAADGKPALFDAIVDDTRGGVGALSGKAGLTLEVTKLREAVKDKATSDRLDQNFDPLVSVITKAQNGELAKTDLDAFEKQYPELLKGGRKASLLAQSANAREALDAAKVKAEAKAQAQRDALQAEDGYVAGAVTAAKLGRFNDVPDVEVPNGTGGTKTLKPQDAADLYVARSRRTLDNPSVPDAAKAQLRGDIAQFFDNSGLTNPEWKRTLNVGANAASIRSLTTNGGVRKDGDGITQASKDGFALFKELKARNGSTLARQDMTDETRQFYERAARVQDQEGSPDDVALMKARERIAAAKENGEPINLRLRDEDILKNLLSATNPWGFRSAPENLTEVLPIVRNRVQDAISDGVSKDDAVKEAMEWAGKNYVSINGSFTRISGQIPTDFQTQTESILGDYFARYGKDEGLDSASDLTVRRAGTENRWVIFNKRTRLPVSEGTPGERSFDLSGLSRWRTSKAREERSERRAWEEIRSMTLPSIERGD